MASVGSRGLGTAESLVDSAAVDAPTSGGCMRLETAVGPSRKAETLILGEHGPAQDSSHPVSAGNLALEKPWAKPLASKSIQLDCQNLRTGAIESLQSTRKTFGETFAAKQGNASRFWTSFEQPTTLHAQVQVAAESDSRISRAAQGLGDYWETGVGFPGDLEPETLPKL
ncbi:hypothetical protein DFH06DRAFT_1119489 [Mycena polygramma]|nr:hypothetical protein DFH06DRAFT_1119489 [Mycena polygramma]